MKDYINPKKAAQILNVVSSTVREWANRGLIPYQTTESGQYRYHLQTVQELAVKRKQDRQIWCPELNRMFSSMEEILQLFPRAQRGALDQALKNGTTAYGQHWVYYGDIGKKELLPYSSSNRECKYAARQYDPETLQVLITTKYVKNPGVGKGHGPRSPQVARGAVRCVETGELFKNASRAGKEMTARLGKNVEVYPCLRGLCPTAGGYHWELVGDTQ